MSIALDISTGADTGLPEIINSVIAFLALIVATTSIYLTLKSIKIQERHNILSLKPIPQITAGDYEDVIYVRIDNNGPGTLIIQDVEVARGSDKRGDVISYMPEDIIWEDYVAVIKGKTIRPGNALTLISLRGDPDSAVFSATRNACRACLAELTVSLTYTDVYDSSFATCKRELTWFSRQKT